MTRMPLPVGAVLFLAAATMLVPPAVQGGSNATDPPQDRLSSALAVETGPAVLAGAGTDAYGGMRDRMAEWLDAYGGAGTVSIAAPDRSVGLVWEGGWRVRPHVGLAVRLGMTVPPDAKVRLRANGAFGEILVADETVSAAAFPVLAGGWMEWRAGWGLKLRGCLFGGPVFASVTRRGSRAFKDPANDEESEGSYSVSSGGTGRMVEVWGEAGYELARGVTVFLGAGWRQAWARRMKYLANADVDCDGTAELVKGAMVERRSGGPLSLDAGGIILGGGVRVSFPGPAGTAVSMEP